MNFFVAKKFVDFSKPRKPRNYYPSKKLRYTVYGSKLHMKITFLALLSLVVISLAGKFGYNKIIHFLSPPSRPPPPPPPPPPLPKQNCSCTALNLCHNCHYVSSKAFHWSCRNPVVSDNIRPFPSVRYKSGYHRLG